ncbi:MAG: hypothetical protein U5K33_07265 [Halofilum sp. (in: g-proteobacteria)]|nr:hypothetical protein [Halofilum sp. (in: g-proteobacteria)]
MRPVLTLFAVALVGAVAITALSTPRSLEDHALDLRLQRALPAVSADLRDEPAGVRTAFVEFAGDEELVLNARLALLRHPSLSRAVIPLYADSRAFRLVLREHGPAAIPPIHYFVTHEPVTLQLRAQVVSWLSQRDGEPGRRPAILSPHERGRYAIEYIRREGHDFLGQFAVTASGTVHWIQSERFATETKRFFTSGLVALETKRRLGHETYASDYGWAAVDVLLPFAAFKAARVGKAAATARAGRVAAHTARAARVTAAGSRAARIASLGRTALKAGAVAGTAYVVMNPGVIGSIGREVAQWTGLPPWLVTGGLWFGLLAPLLLLLGFAWRWLLRPAVLALAGVLAGGRWVHRRLRTEASA